MPFFPARLRPALVLLLAAAGLGLAALAQDRPQAEHLQTAVWPREDHGLGGFSGLTLSADGTRFLAVTDRGYRVEGILHREDGRITEIRDASARRLRDTDGRITKVQQVDAEGIARGRDGTVFVSFEGNHRIWAYPPGEIAARTVDSPAAFVRFAANRGLEALTVDADGTLYTIAEQSMRWMGDFTVWRRTAQGWDDRLTLPRRGIFFLPVGAEIGPDGRLYVLERAFMGIGFRSRVRRFVVGADGLEDETVLLTSPLRRHDNLEGLAVWRDGTGAITLTMISDDNEFRLQETQFVEYRMPGALAPREARR
ncbi:esterase-like activity of phytase family protein [Citreimonas sp.]|uniref:esterase-like activity of phytase family protein n=1 Tax=Citreimonas sp. TaxID=3036715 RepID=UPI004059CAF2